jgi:hypothetical protein
MTLTGIPTHRMPRVSFSLRLCRQRRALFMAFVNINSLTAFSDLGVT